MDLIADLISNAIVHGPVAMVRCCLDRSTVLSLVGAATSIKSFVATSILLLRQKTCFVFATKLVATKMILVASPANDTVENCCLW